MPAPADGKLTSLDVLVDQVVAVGDKVGAVSPGSLSVSAALSQANQFRLLAPPATAQVEVQGGPAPFGCTGLTLGTRPARGPRPPYRPNAPCHKQAVPDLSSARIGGGP